MRVLAGELDFAVAPGVGLPSGLDYVDGGSRDEIVVIVPKGHPFSRRRIVSVAEVAKEPLVTTSPPSVTYSSLREKDKIDGPLEVSMSADDQQTIDRLVSRGAGIRIVSRRVSHRSIEEGRLSVVNVPGFPRMIPHGFILRTGSVPSPETNSLIARLSYFVNEHGKAFD